VCRINKNRTQQKPHSFRLFFGDFAHCDRHHIVGRTLIEDGEARLIFVVSLLELKVALGIALEFY